MYDKVEQNKNTVVKVKLLYNYTLIEIGLLIKALEMNLRFDKKDLSNRKCEIQADKIKLSNRKHEIQVDKNKLSNRKIGNILHNDV